MNGECGVYYNIHFIDSCKVLMPLSSVPFCPESLKTVQLQGN